MGLAFRTALAPSRRLARLRGLGWCAAALGCAWTSEAGWGVWAWAWTLGLAGLAAGALIRGAWLLRARAGEEARAHWLAVDDAGACIIGQDSSDRVGLGMRPHSIRRLPGLILLGFTPISETSGAGTHAGRLGSPGVLAGQTMSRRPAIRLSVAVDAVEPENWRRLGVWLEWFNRGGDPPPSEWKR